MRTVLKFLSGLFLFLSSCISYAQTTDCPLGYIEETVTTKVPYTTGIFSKEEIQVEISGVLWMPCKDNLKPYPLVIYNHGSQDGGTQPTPAGLSPMGKRFTENGYAIFIPIRKGFNRVGTPASKATADRSEPRACNNMQENEVGVQSAISDVRALFKILVFMKKPEIDLTKVTLSGLSRGAWVSIELAAEGLPGVEKVINFSGGWSNERCDGGYTPKKLEILSQKIKVPVISFYGSNDPYYSESFIRSNMQILEKAGVPSSYTIIPGAGHILTRDNVSAWAPMVFPPK